MSGHHPCTYCTFVREWTWASHGVTKVLHGGSPQAPTHWETPLLVKIQEIQKRNTVFVGLQRFCLPQKSWLILMLIAHCLLFWELSECLDVLKNIIVILYTLQWLDFCPTVHENQCLVVKFCLTFCKKSNICNYCWLLTWILIKIIWFKELRLQCNFFEYVCILSVTEYVGFQFCILY